MKAKKTHPKSIRFNLIDLNKGLSKSKLSSPQELVDFLLSDYSRDWVEEKETQEISKADMFKLIREGKM